MKKTVTINLGGIVFNIDDDACDRLSQYLSDLEKRFPEEERGEILRDIEERMAELLTYKLQNRNVVEINDVEEVIEVIGRPEQFDDESGDNAKQEPASNAFSSQEATAGKQQTRRPRKLYRNSNDRMVSGVASGVAAYFDLDPAIVRILFVVLTIISFGWGVLIYLILLIAMPEAKTKAQFLEMQGIEPTLENIDNFHQEPVERSVGSSAIGNIIKICLIVLGVIIGVSLALGVLGIFIAMFSAMLLHTPGSFGNAVDMGLLGSCALFLLCPVIGIAVLCTRAASGERKHKWVGWTLLAVWILSIFGIVGFGIQESKQNDLDKRIERTGEALERWFDEDDYDYTTRDEYYNTDDLDSIINPVLDNLRDEESTYDISIQTNPKKGVNVRIQSNKKADSTLVDTI
ncbi:MAG: PspC domain-containing protein [Bacteroidales bacterium]|nr:PspC domain-containing protein [Bacteroidales bacterium]